MVRINLEFILRAKIAEGFTKLLIRESFDKFLSRAVY
jgi:hypothetical protein